MKGWSEDEVRNKDLMAPCGLHCGTCGIYIATRDKNKKFRDVMANLYGADPEKTVCLGCMQPEPPKMIVELCALCAIRDCVKSKGFYSCHQCEDWPCDQIKDFAVATGRRVIMRTIPVWREKVAEFGDEKGSQEWSRHEFNRYHCSSCGEPLFRGAQRCRACKKEVAGELDGSM